MTQAIIDTMAQSTANSLNQLIVGLQPIIVDHLKVQATERAERIKGYQTNAERLLTELISCIHVQPYNSDPSIRFCPILYNPKEPYPSAVMSWKVQTNPELLQDRYYQEEYPGKPIETRTPDNSTLHKYCLRYDYHLVYSVCEAIGLNPYLYTTPQGWDIRIDLPEVNTQTPANLFPLNRKY